MSDKKQDMEETLSICGGMIYMNYREESKVIIKLLRMLTKNLTQILKKYQINNIEEEEILMAAIANSLVHIAVHGSID